MEFNCLWVLNKKVHLPDSSSKKPHLLLTATEAVMKKLHLLLTAPEAVMKKALKGGQIFMTAPEAATVPLLSSLISLALAASALPLPLKCTTSMKECSKLQIDIATLFYGL